jgi:hypothetical protein
MVTASEVKPAFAIEGWSERDIKHPCYTDGVCWNGWAKPLMTAKQLDEFILLQDGENDVIFKDPVVGYCLKIQHDNEVLKLDVVGEIDGEELYDASLDWCWEMEES